MNIRKAIVTIGLTLAAIGGGSYHYYKKVTTPPPQTQIVHPLPRNELFLGIFANHASDGRHLSCFEQLVGKKFDFSVRYLDITKEFFPVAEAKLMSDTNRILFLKIKITPDLISKENLAKQLSAFNDGAKEFGGKVLLGFDLSKVTNHDPSEMTKILSVFQKAIDAQNITWVWNSAFGIPPKNIEWISVEIFQRNQEGRWPTFAEMFNQNFKNNLRDKSVTLTIGSLAPEDSQTKFFEEAIEFAKNNPFIKALIFHHVPTTKNGKFENWQISTQAFAKIKELLKGGQVDSSVPSSEALENYFVPKSLLEKLFDSSSGLGDLDLSTTCPEIMESDFYTSAQIESFLRLRSIIQEINQSLPRQEGNSQEPLLRQTLANHYISLAYLFEDEVKRIKYFETALNILQEPLNRIKEGEKPKRYPIIHSYFDLMLQIASAIDRTGNTNEAEKIYSEILKNLDNPKIREQMQVSEYAQAGYQNRAKVFLAQIHEKKGKWDEALALYQEVNKWAGAEQNLDLLSLTWRGENRTKIRHTATLAKLGIARIALAQEKPKDALDALRPIFMWEEVGSEKGFMDLGFQGLLLAAKAVVEISPDFSSAENLFEQIIPLRQFKQYEDLKRALEFKSDINLSTILQGLNNVNLDFESRMILKEIQLKYEILKKK